MAHLVRFTSSAIRRIAPLLALLIAGCGGSIESDIRQRFVERHEKPLCVEFTAPFPSTAVVGAGGDVERWLIALTESGMLRAQPIPQSRPLLGLGGARVRFELTDAGRGAITADHHFCYGRAEIVEVIDYTQPSSVNGVQTVQAEARLRRRVDADWARHPAVADLVRAGDQTVSMVLVKKAKGGWSPAY